MEQLSFETLAGIVYPTKQEKKRLRDIASQPPAMPVETSLAAADKISKLSKTKRDEMALLTWLKYRDGHGATDDEIREYFNWDGDYERPRRWTLCKKGLIHSSSFRRETQDGNPAIVWMKK